VCPRPTPRNPNSLFMLPVFDAGTFWATLTPKDARAVTAVKPEQRTRVVMDTFVNLDGPVRDALMREGEVRDSGDATYTFYSVATPPPDWTKALSDARREVLNNMRDKMRPSPRMVTDINTMCIELKRRCAAGVPCGVLIDTHSRLYMLIGGHRADTFAYIVLDILTSCMAILTAFAPRVKVRHDGPDAVELACYSGIVRDMHELYLVRHARAMTLVVVHAASAVAQRLSPPYNRQFTRAVNATVTMLKIAKEMGLDTSDGLNVERACKEFDGPDIGQRALLFATTDGDFNIATTRFAADWHSCCIASLMAIVKAYANVAHDALVSDVNTIMLRLAATARPDPAPASPPPPPPPRALTPETTPALDREWERCRRRVIYDAVLAAYGTRAVAYDHDALTSEFGALSAPASPHSPMRGFERDVDALTAQLRELRRK
jgi:hypothetical protein